MQPEAKKLEYPEISALFQERKVLISEEHASKIDVFQRSMEVAFYLNKFLYSAFSEQYIDTGEKHTGPMALIPILFERNNHYLIAAHELTLLGLSNPSYLNLRAVYEGITQMYLLKLTEKEANLFYKKEIDDLTTEEEKELKNKHEWLRPAKVRKILYSGEKKALADQLYSVVSNSAHPSVKGAMSDFQLKHPVISDILDVSLALSVSNLFAISESYYEIIGEKEIEGIEEVLDMVSREYGDQTPDMIPNHPNIIDKLNIRFQ